MRRVSWLLAALPAFLLYGTVAGSAVAASDDDDDDDNAPPATAPAPPAAQRTPVAAPPVAAPQPAAPALTPPPMARAPLPAAVDTTPVSAETMQLGGDVDRLHDALAQHEQSIATLHADRNGGATAYYGLTSDLGRKLAIGAPPGDPALSDELARARGALEQLRTNTAQLATVSNQLTEDAGSALNLAGQVQNRLATPGIGSNERAALAAIESRLSATQADSDQRLRDVLGEIGREQRSLAVETQNLAQLERGIVSGALEPASEAAPRTVAEMLPPAPHDGAKPAKGAARHPAGSDPAPVPDGPPRPLVVIARDSTGRSYEHQLYAAVAAVLQRSPGASFTVRATTPVSASLATRTLQASDLQHRAADVVRSLTTFGLPRSKIAVTQGSDGSVAEPQIEVFVERGG